MGILGAFSNAAAAYDLEVPKCPLPAGASRSYTIAALPEPIRMDFLKRIRGPIAAPGEDFNATDIVIGSHSPPQRRLIQIDHQENRWVIAYEVGGIGHYAHIAGYRMQQSKNEAELFASISGDPALQLCDYSARLLAGQIPQRQDDSW